MDVRCGVEQQNARNNWKSDADVTPHHIFLMEGPAVAAEKRSLL
jgi:hypothetical protein